MHDIVLNTNFKEIKSTQLYEPISYAEPINEQRRSEIELSISLIGYSNPGSLIVLYEWQNFHTNEVGGSSITPYFDVHY